MEDQGFIAAIRDNPDDDGLCSIYADWLDERGDPRGEFLRLECRLKNTPEREEFRHIQARRKELLRSRINLRWLLSLGKPLGSEIVDGIVTAFTERFIFVQLHGLQGTIDCAERFWNGRGWEEPGDLYTIGQRLEVSIGKVDEQQGMVALWPHTRPNQPWGDAETKYPVGSHVVGEVVNVMTYGAFVRLKKGFEGLIFNDQIPSTQRIADAREVVQIGERLEVEILTIDRLKQEMSLRLIRRLAGADQV